MLSSKRAWEEGVNGDKGGDVGSEGVDGDIDVEMGGHEGEVRMSVASSWDLRRVGS